MAGIKHDSKKPRLSLIPSKAMLEVGKVFTFGAEKYGDYNWCDGINYSRLLSAGMRHRSQFNSGQDLDDESTICHIAHSIANDLMLLQFHLDGRVDLDDRHKEVLEDDELLERLNERQEKERECCGSGCHDD